MFRTKLWNACVSVLLALLLAVSALAVVRDAGVAAKTWAFCGTGSAYHQFPSGLAVYGNEWNSGQPQQICADSPTDVQVTAQMTPTGSNKTCPAVLTYPDVQWDFPAGGTAISSLREVRTYYTESQPAYPAAIGEFAGDDWATTPGGPGNQFEIMEWNDNQGQGPPPGTETTGVKLPGGTYDLFHSGDYFAFVRTVNETHGFVPHLAAWKYLIAHGLLPADAVITQAEVGWEICTDPAAGGTYRISGGSWIIK